MLLLDSPHDQCTEFSVHFDGDRDDFNRRCNELARRHIEGFFSPKQFYCGGPIPTCLTRSMRGVTAVVSLPFMPGMGVVYEVMEKRPMRPPFGYDPDVHGELDVFTVLGLIDELRASKVPVEFQAGMILLYLNFCRGCDIPRIEYNVSHLIR